MKPRIVNMETIERYQKQDSDRLQQKADECEELRCQKQQLEDKLFALSKDLSRQREIAGQLTSFLSHIAYDELTIRCSKNYSNRYDYVVTFRPSTKVNNYEDFCIKVLAHNKSEYDQGKIDLLIKATEQFQIADWKAKQDPVWNYIVLYRTFSSVSIQNYRPELAKAQEWITNLIKELIKAQKIKDLVDPEKPAEERKEKKSGKD